VSASAVVPNVPFHDDPTLTEAARCGSDARALAGANRPAAVASGVGVSADSSSWFVVDMAELSFWKMASISSMEAGAVAGRSIRR